MGKTYSKSSYKPFQTQNGQEVDCEHPTWIYTGKSCPSSLDASFDDMAGSVDEVGEVDIIFLDYKKAFDTVFFNIFTARLVRYGLDDKVSGKLFGLLDSEGCL